MFYFVTMKHTGTHFMFKHFKNMGLSKGVIDVGSGVITQDGDFVHLHIDEPNHKATELISGLVVTTLRNPVNVFRSYGKRCQWSVERIAATVISAFNNWLQFEEMFDPIVIAVDGKLIDTDIQRLFRILDINGFEYSEVDPVTAKAATINRSDYSFDKEPPIEILELAKKFGY